MTFPDRFADTTQALTAENMPGQTSRQDIADLAAKGYEVHVGLTPAFAEQIIVMAREPDIREYCPNDIGKRFVDLAAAEQWLTKGRAVFLLLKRNPDGLRLAGYGWAGAATDERVPGGTITFAIRVGELGHGQKLATPYCRLIVNGAAVLYEARDIWGEAWGSNRAALHVYHKVGFEEVLTVAAARPTAAGGTLEDTRVFMRLPNDRLDT